MEGRERFRSRSLCIIDATLQSVLHYGGYPALHILLMYDRGNFLFLLREEPHLSTLGSHESMADTFLSHHLLHLHLCNTSCVSDRHRRSTSSAPAVSIDSIFPIGI
jgi:hypothetical protein